MWHCAQWGNPSAFHPHMGFIFGFLYLAGCVGWSLIKICSGLRPSNARFISIRVHSRMCIFVPDEGMLRQSALAGACFLVFPCLSYLCNGLFQNVRSPLLCLTAHCTLFLGKGVQGIASFVGLGHLHLIKALFSVMLTRGWLESVLAGTKRV